MSWEENARCRTHDPEIFFVPRVAFERRAKTICSRCDVRTDCLAFSLDTRIEFGIWGGLNEKERKTMLRRAPHTIDWSAELAARTKRAG